MTTNGKQPEGDPSRATEGMGGDGYYDSHSQVQQGAVLGQTDRLRNAVRHLHMTADELRVMDYGCGPGRNSMVAFHTVLDEIRQRRSDMPVVAGHSDQIGNDWNDLFANIRGPGGYLNEFPSVRVEASVGDFFGPVAGAQTVDLGMSVMAVHWLSAAVPLLSPGTLFFCDVEGPTREEIAAHADRDWIAFFRQRARELKSDGWLIVETLSSVPDPDDPSGLLAAGRRLYRAFWRIARELADEGRIDTGVLENFVFPVYFRGEQEARAPFEREDDLKAAFEIVELTSELLPTPHEDEFKRNGDVAAYAAAYVGYARGFSESTFRNGLFGPSTSSPDETDRLTDMFYDRLEQLFRDEPDRHVSETQSMTLVLRRR